MGFGSFVHYVGAFLLLAATVLLVVASISSPVVNDIAVFTVDLPAGSRGSDITFGTFGYCLRGVVGGDECSKAQVGYNPAAFIDSVLANDAFGHVASNTAKDLTNVMVLHPVAAGLCFIGFLLCLGTGFVGSLIASLFSFLAFVVTAVVLICDFVAFSGLKHDINDDINGAYGHYSVAIWLVLVAGILAFFATILVFITCCCARDRKDNRRAQKGAYDGPADGGY